jgi:hypothetical protein
VVDPDDLRLTAWELSGGRYVEVADLAGTELWTAERPFPVSVAPDALGD